MDPSMMVPMAAGTDLRSERTLALGRLFPEAVREGRVDWEALRAALGEDVGEGPERYRFAWAGRGEAVRQAFTPGRGALVPVREESVRFDEADHLFLEGDNLEVLRLLRTAYRGQVRLIFIDPPYNTGGHFVYSDRFADPLDRYLEATGQKDASGRLLTGNPETGGRHHSAWLSMMYPRLVLARELLREDGLLFVTIDDHEVHHLRLLLNEIFGEEQFLAQITWVKSYSPQMDARGFSASHDYVLVYGRTAVALPRRLPLEQNAAQFSRVDAASGRPYRRRSLRKEGSNSLRSDSPGCWYPLLAPDGTEVWPHKPRKAGEETPVEGCWRWSASTYAERVASGEVEWVQTEREGWQPYARQFLDEEASAPPGTVWSHEEVGHNHEAAQEVAALLGPRVFDTPKPTRLLRRILQLGTSPRGGDIVLDFFAGSCSTAQAVLEQNREDGGDRRFIMVQVPEPTEGPYATVAEIGKERIRRVLARLSQTLGSAGARPALRVFRVAPSRLRAWEAPPPDIPAAAYADHMEACRDPLQPGGQAEEAVWEVALREGIPLTTRLRQVILPTGGTLWEVEEEGRRLRICLEESIPPQALEAMELRPEDRLICRSSALDDTTAVHAALRCRLQVL